MSRSKEWTAKEVAEALEKAGGIKKHACEILGCSYPTIYRYMRDYKTVRDAAEKGKDMMRGEAENTIRNAITKGDTSTAKWFLARFDEDYKDEPQQIDVTSNGESLVPRAADVTIYHANKDEDEGEEQ